MASDIFIFRVESKCLCEQGEITSRDQCFHMLLSVIDVSFDSFLSETMTCKEEELLKGRAPRLDFHLS